MFFGRDHEERVIGELIGGLPEHGGALLVIGDPGIGKSQLISVARQSAARGDLAVIDATGVPAESRLPYAGLHQLLRTLREEVEALPGRRRNAILTAFGQESGETPDRFLIALAVTDLLTAAANRRPLAVLIDDAHWLDSPTGDVLSFLARRIDREPIALLATARDGYPVPLLQAGLPELRLSGLAEGHAGELLDAVSPGLPEAARRAILDTALGNPLALTELSQDTAPLELPRAETGGLPLTHRVERAFAARWSELPEETGTVLLVAALNEGGALGETLEAAGLLIGTPVTAEALDPAISARLVEAGRTSLRFRHPLVRSAIEYRAGPNRLAAAHHALASVMADRPDRRAWHRAAAALGPDEEVAAELDGAAERAGRRGAISVAITALERAVELSRDPSERTGRLLRAAQLAFELGRPAQVKSFLMSVSGLELPTVDRARLALLEEGTEAAPADEGERIRALVALARETAADGQRELAMEVLLVAARRCWQNHPGTDVRLLVARTALELTKHPLHPTLLSVLAFATPDVHGAMARERLARMARGTTLDATQLADLGAAGTVIGVPREARALLGTAIPQLRDQRRLGILIVALIYNSYNGMYLCQWDDVLASADEAIRTATEAARPRWIPVATVPKVHVAAVHGDIAEAERLATEAEPMLLSLGANTALALLRIARGLAAIGQRDYHTAYEHLITLSDPASSSFSQILRMYHVGDLAEAAVRSGHRSQAQALFAEVSAAATGDPGPLLGASIAYAAAMLAQDGDDNEDAERHFEAALEGGLQQSPLAHARLKLEYGSWLRRHQQAARSREYLRSARDELDTIGAKAWRKHADEELRAAGVRPPAAPERSGRLDQLTPQEERIARMVTSGLSNKEIGERLSLSHRTVGYHLYRMFPKLGITSRVELVTVFAESAAHAATDPGR